MTEMDKRNLGLKNRGDFHERTKYNPLEKAFADHWEVQNNTRTSSYHGVGLLQALFHSAGHEHHVTASERFVVATVVQWLGTNVGFGFLMSVLRKSNMRIVDVDTGKPIDLANVHSPYKRKFG
jgi:hypothetical protein